MAGHDAGFEAWWQMNTRATSFERSASSSRAAEMANRESVLRLAVRQAKPASRQAVLMHRAIQRAQDASHFSSSLSSSSKSSSHHDEITSGVQLAELIAAVKRADEPNCSRWVALAAQHDVWSSSRFVVIEIVGDLAAHPRVRLRVHRMGCAQRSSVKSLLSTGHRSMINL